jgi:hypothetical protein
METRDLRLDGNAIGGLLLDVFGADLTAAGSVCGGCGAHEIVARLDVYVNAPGVVVRCRHCDAVMIRIVQGGGRTWLDLSGTGSLEISR